MKPTLFTSKDRILEFGKGAAMNDQYGIQVMLTGDREKLQALVPPILKVPAFTKDGEREQGVVYIYIVNIRQPTFGPWYMEGGVGIMVDYQGVTGLHFLGLQLSGPGALMGMCTGREGSGLPKKLADRIHVERLGDHGHCYIERGGVRLVDVECDIGQYNTPLMHTLAGAQEGATQEKPIDTEGGCLLFRSAGGVMPQGMELIKYDSPTLFRQWDPMTAKVTFGSTVNDPWGEIPVDGVIGGGWMVSDNRVRSTDVLYRFPADECLDAMQYLYAGKFDQCLTEKEHQSSE